MCPACYQPGGSLLHCPSTLTCCKIQQAVYFCCTVPRVTPARRYLASCPVKPGLSSPASSRYRSSDHLSYSQLSYSSIVFFLCLWGKFKKLRFCSEGSERLPKGPKLPRVRKPPARITDAHLGENPLFVACAA